MSPSPPAYRPREFWQERLSEHFDLRGTGHPGCSFDYNLRCYWLRALVLDSLLARHGVPVAGQQVLDAGCGTGFFVEHFLGRGATVSGVDLTDVAVSELGRRFPQATFEVGDLSTWRPKAAYDLVSCMDVLFHITEESLWDAALTHLADAVRPGGYFVFTEYFPRRRPRTEAAHNVARGWEAYLPALHARGLAVLDHRPTHHLMNTELGLFRFLNRFPRLLYAVDRSLLDATLLEGNGANRMVLCRRSEAGNPPRLD